MNGPKLHIPSRPVPMKAAPMPKVAICIPSGDTVHKGFAMALASLTYMSGPINGMQAIPIALVGIEGSLIVNNRNFAIKEAQRLGVDYVLFLDSDMIFPPQALRRLLQHGKDIVGATYVQRDPPHRLLGNWKAGLALTSDSLHEVDTLPAGCLLIKLSVFDGAIQPYFRTPAIEATPEQEGWIMGEDVYFCTEAAKRGHKVWLDAGLTSQIGHVGRHVAMVPTTPVNAANETQEVSDGQVTTVH